MKRRGTFVKGHAALRELPPELLHDAVFPLAGQVHLVNKQKRRNPVAAQKLPERSRVALHAVCPAHKQQRKIQHLKRPLHLGGKVHMSRRIQKRDACLRERQLRLLGKNRDAARAFLLVRVQKRVLMVDPAKPPRRAAFKKHRLQKRCLPRVHMGHHADANMLHKKPPNRSSKNQTKSARSRRWLRTPCVLL